MSEIEILQENIKHDQIEYEKQRNEYEQHIDTKKDHVDQLKSEYVRLVKEVASKAVFSRSGKAISNQVCISPFDHTPTHLQVNFIQDWRTPPRNFSLVGISSLT